MKAKTKYEYMRYARIGGSKNKTKIGERQFIEYESTGKFPEQPDSYFNCLLDGKKWWEWTLNEFASLYGKWEWPGWLQLEQDFDDDLPGLKQVVQRIKQRWRGLEYIAGSTKMENLVKAVAGLSCVQMLDSSATNGELFLNFYIHRTPLGWSSLDTLFKACKESKSVKAEISPYYKEDIFWMIKGTYKHVVDLDEFAELIAKIDVQWLVDLKENK